MKWLKKAGEQGQVDAQLSLGNKYLSGQGVPQSYDETAKWFKLAADQGNGNSQSNLGVLYAMGNGVPRNDVEAYKWWEIAVARGYEGAKGNQEALSKRMTETQIAEAKKLAAAWKPASAVKK